MLRMHNYNKNYYRSIGSAFVILLGILSMLGMGGCGGGDGDLTSTQTVTTCTNTPDDSQLLNNVVSRIDSAFSGAPTYKFIPSVRKKTNNSDVSIDYMVHPAAMPKAVLVLIAGGQMTAGITGDINTGQVTATGGNFLVRSAHLFAAKGYTVITIDQPDDFLDDTLGSTSGFAYDGYRTSVRHTVDISSIVNSENIDHLPVIILGTSRGAISAVAQHPLASAISLSSPVTTGSGTPVDQNSGQPLVRPGMVDIPAHVMWHVKDGCSVSPPGGSAAIVSDFNPDAASNAVQGGFDDPAQPNSCQANTVHGFLGIESCAVGLTTNRIDMLVAGLPSPQVQAAAIADTTTTNTPLDIDLSSFVTDVANGALQYQLPFVTTSLGGALSLAGSVVTYTPPAGLSGTIDSFVYVVEEVGGGKSHNVIKVTITP